MRLHEVPADQSTPEGQECLMDVSTFFVSYAQATKLIQPREGPFHNPPPSSQTAGRVSYCAWPARARCGGHETLAGASRRHRHGHPTHTPDDTEDVLSDPVWAESHRRAAKLVGSRDSWPRLIGSLEEHPDHRRSDGVCCPAWLYRSDWDQSAPPKNGAHGTTIYRSA